MFASTRNALARSGASPALRVAARRTALPRHRLANARFASTTEQAQAAVKASEGSVFSTGTGAGPSSASSHLAAGIAGGATVILAGYTYYQFSSLKTAVDAAQSTAQYAQQTKDKISQSVQATFKDTNTGEALKYLRGVAKSYVGLIPGAGSYIDATFDSFDKLAETHGPEVEKISRGAYDEIQAAYKEAKSKGTVDADIALKVADILRRRLTELYELGKRAGGDVVNELLESHPEVKEKLGGGYEQLQKLAQDKGPEAKKLLDDTQSQVKEIFAKGFSAEAVMQARELIQQKTEQARQLAEPAAREAWDKALQQAQPALEKLPEIKQYLDSNASTFVAAGAGLLGGSGVQEIVKRVKDVATKEGKEREQQVKELKEWLEQQAKDASGKAGAVFGIGWEDVQKYVQRVPGGDELLEKVPNAKALLELSADKGEEARKLARETWEDLLKVLEEKGRKAKEIAEGAKEEAKEPAKGAKEEVKDKAGEAKDKAQEKAGEAKDKVQEKAGEAKDKVGEAKDQAKEKASEVKDKAQEKAGEAKEKAEEKAEDVKDKAKGRK